MSEKELIEGEVVIEGPGVTYVTASLRVPVVIAVEDEENEDEEDEDSED